MNAQQLIDTIEPEQDTIEWSKEKFYPTLWRQEQADRDLTFCLKQFA
jgi:hypothetical protein